jgi:hypothetical protein
MEASIKMYGDYLKMQSRFNEDTPYWPQFNTATYKEVWDASAARWLSLIAEF